MLSGRKPLARTLATTALTVMTFVLAVFAYTAFAPIVHAQDNITANEILNEDVGEVIGTGTEDIRIVIARLIRAAFGFLGIIAVLLILYAGFIWMTAAGEAEKVDRAKKILTSAIIGLLIIMSAFGIVSFIISRLLGEVGGGGGGGGGESSAPDDRACIGLSATCPAGALGNGIVEGHFPARNATGIARNTRVVITFKEAIDPASIVLGGAEPTVAILRSVSVVGTSNQFPAKFAQSLTGDDIEIASTPDNKTFAFIQKNCPTDCFGSPSENVFYTVALRGGTDGVKKAGGAAAFSGTFNSGYLWEFQVSTVLDLTPPVVDYSIPDDGDNEVPRNSLVQVTFNEAVDPVSIASCVSVTRPGGAVIQGVQSVGNSYRSLEFRTNDACGTNSCGETVYCLPASTEIDVRVKADGLTATPPTGIFPPNGVTDMAGNSLDGDADGTAEGPTDDDYAYSFTTNNTIDLVPPKVVSQDPATLQGNIARDLRMTATFSKLMSFTSMTSSTVRLVPGSGGAPTNYWVDGDVVSSVAGGEPDQGVAQIHHDLLSLNQPYAASLTSGLRDLRQNCFFPGAGQTVCTGNEPFCCNGVPSLTACPFAP
jgi:type IV secretion system pilin/Big-like domain-containing protein